MAINATKSASNGRNVEPISSVLHIKTLSVNCSAFTLPPVDGQWVFFAGSGAAAGQLPSTNIGNTTTAYEAAPGDQLLLGNVADRGASLCMVWSESGRADIQALGDSRIPVKASGSLHCKLSLYNYDSTDLPVAGNPVVVRANKAAVYGRAGLDPTVATISTDAERMVATVYGDGAPALTALKLAKSWIVGYVVRSVATAGDPLEVMLYDHPVPASW